MRLVAFIAIALLALSGCHTLPKAAVGPARATAPRDNGTPATANRTQTAEALAVPAGSIVNVSRAAATPTSPAIEQTKITIAGDSEYRITRDHTAATTGTIDTEVAKHRIDADQRALILYAAIGALILGLVLRGLLPSWPGLSNGLLGAAVVLGLAWKFSEIPVWIAVIPAGIAVLMALGYKRAEWDANRNFIPDILEKK